MTRPVAPGGQSGPGLVTVGHYTWQEVEEATNMTFNTVRQLALLLTPWPPLPLLLLLLPFHLLLLLLVQVIMDCEGCYYDMVRQYRSKFRQVDKVSTDLGLGPAD